MRRPAYSATDVLTRIQGGNVDFFVANAKPRLAHTKEEVADPQPALSTNVPLLADLKTTKVSDLPLSRFRPLVPPVNAVDIFG
jgi:hypothetical protein